MSVVVLTHAVPHAVCPAAQTHAPAVHVAPDGHTRPQAPQFMLLDCTSMHMPLHSAWPAAHTHAPAVHVAPVGHALPHAPQFMVFVCVFTHVDGVPQAVCIAGH